MKEIIKAASILKHGGLVAMPTETVYGLAADASNEAAIKKIFAVKERPYSHPLIVHLARIEQIEDWAQNIPEQAWKLAKIFWPGPLTLILKKQAHVLDAITAGQDSIGLRIPRHPIAQALLQNFGGGLAAPSANKFTHISPTTANAVREELGTKVDLILDGGDCEIGLESTIIDLTNDSPCILRPGMISKQMLMGVLGKKIIMSEYSEVRAPGMHHLHYAPITTTSLINENKIYQLIKTISENDLPIALITHSMFEVAELKNLTHIQLSNDATVFAHHIYRILRELDNQHFHKIFIEEVPETIEWEAVRDRLNKACR